MQNRNKLYIQLACTNFNLFLLYNILQFIYFLFLNIILVKQIYYKCISPRGLHLSWIHPDNLIILSEFIYWFWIFFFFWRGGGFTSESKQCCSQFQVFIDHKNQKNLYPIIRFGYHEKEIFYIFPSFQLI